MFKKILIVITCILSTSSVLADDALRGHWVGLNNKSIIEFSDNEIIVTLMNENDSTKMKANMKKIAESRYHLVDKERGHSAVLVMDKKQNIFSIQNLQNHFTILNFKPAPQITQAELMGTWYSRERIDDNYETSTIITQKGETYDYDFLDISHYEKSYTREVDTNIKYTIKNGFSFHENPSDSETEEYIYYLTSFENNTIHYTDSYGDTWTEYKKEGATHPNIPKGYTERKTGDE